MPAEKVMKGMGLGNLVIGRRSGLKKKRKRQNAGKTDDIETT
jgi:hypothetical protein